MESRTGRRSTPQVVTPDHLIPHLFLPKSLSNSEPRNLPEIELTLLEYVNQVAGPLLHQTDLQKTRSAFSTWLWLQSKQDELKLSSQDRIGSLGKALRDLKEGESACLYVRRQNCTIYFTKLNKEFMRIITFRASLPNETITGTCGSIQVKYPETLDIIPISPFLLSSALSQQLEHLTSNIIPIAMPMTKKAGKDHVEVREPSHPYMVSDFLVGMLCPVDPEDAKTFGDLGDVEKIKFKKKLRDQINWSNNRLPFRRSGLWTSVKVILQLSLQEEMMNKEDAYMLYKIITLEVLIFVAMEHNKKNTSSWDVTRQILAKLTRRAKKLSEMKTEREDLTALLEKTSQNANSAIDTIRAPVSEQWSSAVVETPASLRITKIIRSTQDWNQDCIHPMNGLTAYLEADRNPKIEQEQIDSRMESETSTVSLKNLLEQCNFRKGVSGISSKGEEDEKLGWLYQVERFARLHIGDSCGEIFKLLKVYFDNAFNLYGRSYADPVYYSRLAITFFKFVKILDEIAVREHPLLKEYKTGIQPEMFHSLQVPEECETELAIKELQDYFAQRNAHAQYENWLSDSRIKGTDFCVQFAKRNDDMKKLKSKILEKMQRDIQDKLQEIQRVRSDCVVLNGKISQLSCSCKENEHGPDRLCKRCSLLSQLDRKRISVSRYQRPLPPEEHLQSAVVFELLIPQEIAVLRDSVVLLLGKFLGKPILTPEVSGSIYTKWTEFCELEQYEKTGHQDLCHLGSENKDILRTHYGRDKPDVLNSLDEEFILDNGLNCKYYRTRPFGTMLDSPFTFKIATAEKQDAESYGCLQFALNVTRPTENQVIASQYRCHQNLDLSEFKSFGSLRATPLLQLRNLYQDISSEVLHLEKEPVLQLIMQTLWELGPGRREIHEDLELEENKQFAMEFLDLLRTSGETYVSKWDKPVALFSLTVAAVRILEINECAEIKERASEILKRYRDILDEWCVTLEGLLTTAAVGSMDHMELLKYLLKAAVCCMFTFNVSAQVKMPYIFQGPSDVTQLLKTLSRLNQLIVRENILNTITISSFMQNLLRHARHAVPLNIFDYLNEILGKSDFNAALHEFACSKWTEAKSGSSTSIPTFIQSEGQKRHAYQAEYQISGIKYKACVDILRGTFFVDGYPPSVLPERIIRNPLFRSFFRTSQFRVQRDSGTFRTTDQYRGHHFEFMEIQGGLIIRQLSLDGHWFELVPKALLEGKVPHDTIRNYTHWFNSKTKALHFRGPSSSYTEENIEKDTEYVLVPATTHHAKLSDKWYLRKYIGATDISNEYLLSINSSGFQMVVNNLKKLEERSFMHVIQHKSKGQISVNLSRLYLTFTLNQEEGLLYCDKYQGYYLPLSETGGQNLGTLVGLQSGIVLETKTVAEPSGIKKRFLIQHGTLSISSGGIHSHQSVAVVVDERAVRSPPYFEFEVDNINKRLQPRSNKSAWLYLAALHASTSSPFPDPFTQLTGVEMAVQILQSGRVWSCSPYDSECLNTLEQIANLSPKYSYYPGDYLKVMEIVTWPSGLDKNSYAAYDGYAIIVEKLWKDSMRLSGLFTEGSCDTPNFNYSDLCTRSYWRNVNIYNKAAHLSDEFINESSTLKSSVYTLSSRRPNSKVRDPETDVVTEYKIDRAGLAVLSQYRRKKIASPPRNYLDPFIERISPISSSLRDKLTQGNLSTWLYTKLSGENWLQLYSLAYNSRTGNNEHELTLILGAMLYTTRGSVCQLLNLHNISTTHHGINFPEPLKSQTKSYGKNNQVLKLFVTAVDSSLLKLEDNTEILSGYCPPEGMLYFKTVPDTVDKWVPELESVIGMKELKKPCAIAKRICSTGQLAGTLDNFHSKNPSQQRDECLKLLEKYSNRLKKIATHHCPADSGLEKAGIHVRIAPVTLLPSFLNQNERSLLEGGNYYVGALAVIMAHLKKLNRNILYSNDENKYSTELEREKATQECEDWNPLEYPEWLLLELELDITIRSIQAEVAKRMIRMPNEKNGVMQLNMGEGKTSVIMPMILATLSKSKDCLCRLTVLNSIYTTNYNLLTFTIGGFLNRRLYTVPCSREIDIGKHLGEIDKIYKECLRLGGTVVTLPERRLSFRLQMYNSFLQGKHQDGLQIGEIETWLRKHARDLVDESDEIFNVRYQLIYTTGKQLRIDGGSMRWTVCQKLLEFVPHVAAELWEKYGTGVIEFQCEKANKCPEEFPPIRFLGDECKAEFSELMADGILDGKVNLIGRPLRDDERKIIKQFLTNENISEEDHRKLDKIEGVPTEKRLILFLVSGYLRRGFLFNALKKRWRVEYGVKEPIPGVSTKLMAVPFRAKDVASERTEFGHPDMAIVLTQLSYYNSGLSDEQLLQCFHILQTAITGPEAVYNSWIEKVPQKKIKFDTVRSYHSINIQDYEQRTEQLFPLLRKHKAVVDFWLQYVAFPKECRQFPGKLTANTWDLCYERNEHATTGFSGTNDTSLLLPAKITQQDLPSLSETNVQTEETLKRKENQWKRSLDVGDGCREVLKFMIQDGLRVLIDTGALMLEFGNEEIAELWLELDTSLEAVVYFNKTGEMVIKVRRHAAFQKESKRERDQPLVLSPFSDRLENCGIYLDDQHTRGTDINLPTNFRACVTIGSGMRRDKLIQACMRMRKLGKGQSVHFYLSHEVNHKITSKMEQQTGITTKDISNWANLNSDQFEEDGLVHWAINARNYAKNLVADDLFEASPKSIEEGKALAERCEDPAAQELQDMYGTYRHKSLVTKVIPKWFYGIPNKLAASGSLDGTMTKNMNATLEVIKTAVLTKCRDHIPDKILYHSMLEEKEGKELEPEQEVEVEKYRPPEETPLEPSLHLNVSRCVKGRTRALEIIGISRLCDVFRDTTIRSKIEAEGWGNTCFASDDFIKVIKASDTKRGNDMDCFLRSIRYFVSFKNDLSTTVLILSLYEVNHLISYFRDGKCKSGTTLHMFSGRWKEEQPIFANEPRLQLPFRSETEAIVDENVLAPVLIASGNLYFRSMEEQKAFARFLGLQSRPRTEEQTALERKRISSSGLSGSPEQRSMCKFAKDPSDMVRGILKIRNDVLLDSDHTVSILESCTFVPSNEQKRDRPFSMLRKKPIFRSSFHPCHAYRAPLSTSNVTLTVNPPRSGRPDILNGSSQMSSDAHA